MPPVTFFTSAKPCCTKYCMHAEHWTGITRVSCHGLPNPATTIATTKRRLPACLPAPTASLRHSAPCASVPTCEHEWRQKPTPSAIWPCMVEVSWLYRSAHLCHLHGADAVVAQHDGLLLRVQLLAHRPRPLLKAAQREEREAWQPAHPQAHLRACWRCACGMHAVGRGCAQSTC